MIPTTNVFVVIQLEVLVKIVGLQLMKFYHHQLLLVYQRGFLLNILETPKNIGRSETH